MWISAVQPLGCGQQGIPQLLPGLYACFFISFLELCAENVCCCMPCCWTLGHALLLFLFIPFFLSCVIMQLHFHLIHYSLHNRLRCPLMEMQGWTRVSRSVVTYLCAEACRVGQREYNYATHPRSNAFIFWYKETVDPSTWIGFACFVWYGLSGEEFRYFVYFPKELLQKLELLA